MLAWVCARAQFSIKPKRDSPRHYLLPHLTCKFLLCTVLKVRKLSSFLLCASKSIKTSDKTASQETWRGSFSPGSEHRILSAGSIPEGRHYKLQEWLLVQHILFWFQNLGPEEGVLLSYFILALCGEVVLRSSWREEGRRVLSEKGNAASDGTFCLVIGGAVWIPWHWKPLQYRWTSLEYDNIAEKFPVKHHLLRGWAW